MAGGFIFNYIPMYGIQLAFRDYDLGFPAPILLALQINQVKSKKAKKTLQPTIYLPHFISLVVMVGLLNGLLSPNTGIIGFLLTAVGLGDICFDFAVIVLCALVFLIVAYPLYFVVIASISDSTLISTRIWIGYKNTVIYPFLF